MKLALRLALGLFGLVAIAACGLGWRLAQGPLDVAFVLHRAQPWLGAAVAPLRFGGASLAWEGFGARDRPLVIRLHDVSLELPDGPQLRLVQARLGLSIGNLLRGQFTPDSVDVQGAVATLRRRDDGWLVLPRTEASPGAGSPPWPTGLRRLQIHDATIELRDEAMGVIWQVGRLSADAVSVGQGLAGTAGAELQANGVRTTLSVQAQPQAGGTRVSATLGPVNLAALARLSPRLAGLGVLDAQVGLNGSIDFDAGLRPVAGRLLLKSRAGTLAVGTGSVGLAQVTATLSGTMAELHLDAVRVAFARPASVSAPSPVVTGQATATRGIGGQVHVAFALGIDGLAMADLSRYWPAGTGGGTRPWLVANVTAGRVHDAHLAGTVDLPPDFSDATLSTLSGGLAIDDATLWWLRPVPPLVHVGGRVVVEGPDSVRVTLDHGSQNKLVLSPDSSIRITGLVGRHQFADIAAGLSGPLADALVLLDHPRLKLLSRGNVEVVDPAGSVAAKLMLHVPLENRVTMDDIPVSATATLAGVHLGRIVGGRDLDQAALALKVTGNGLTLSGTGDIAGIPADLALQMDFLAGPPGQTLQHLVATGHPTAAQLRGAGAPASIEDFFTGGEVGLRVDYAGHRDGTATVQVDADLGPTSLATPVAWTKRAGLAAQVGARVLLDHGRLTGIDHLHAKGPGLVIASRTEFAPNGSRALLLDRLELGGTKAAGRIDLPSASHKSVAIRLSGPMLDFSAYLDSPLAKTPLTPAQTRVDDDAPGTPWSVNLDFAHVQLARREILSPFAVQAASDGTRILRADAKAGDAGDFTAQIVPDGSGRTVSIRADDAGAVLRAVGVADNLRGGSLHLDGRYDDSQPGFPLTGVATLQRFQVTDAPAIGRLLQAMTLYGLVDALRGPGLRFSKLVVPFHWQRRVLTLSNARAFSPSLGLTAQGQIDLRRRAANIQGTLVPAYFFNQLLGDLPLIGRVFSPEKGGGVFAARYSVRGPLADPKIGVNPLSALTPGFLREGFGLFAPAPATSP